MAPRQRRARFPTERAQRAVAATVTLLDDPGEGCGRHAATGAKFVHYWVALAGIELGQRPAGGPRDVIEGGSDHLGVADAPCT